MSMPKHPPVTDEQIQSLVPRCQRGDPAAVEAIYDLYADRLYVYMLARVGDPELAAELTNELFLRMIGHMRRYRLNQRRPASSFSAWLYRIAANLVADHHRSPRSTSQVDLQESWPDRRPGADPLATLERRELLGDLAKAMEQLTEEQRLVLLGKFDHEMNNTQIAQWLGKSEGAVKALQHRALRSLGRLLT